MSRPARFLALALLLSGCSEESAAPPPEPKPRPKAAAPQPVAEVPLPEAATARPAGEGAAQVMQSYYALIEAGEHAEAYKLREPAKGAPSPEVFAQSFERYAEHHATVGLPSEPVESGGWLYVEVPVQTYGRMKDGPPLASGGTVTLRRRARGGAWRIFTKG